MGKFSICELTGPARATVITDNICHIALFIESKSVNVTAGEL